MRWRVVVPVAVLIALVGLLGYGLTRDPHTLPSAYLNRAAPTLALPSLADETQAVRLADMAGRVTLVNVWASWCVACRSEVSELAELSETTDIPVVGIDYKDTRDEASRWLRRFGNPYARIAFDESGSTGIDWGISGVPETFVIDREGRIAHKHIGPFNRRSLEEDILPVVRRLQEGAGS